MAGLVGKTGGRRPGSKNKATLEFNQAYNKYLKQYECPVKTLFEIKDDQECESAVRLKAAKILVDHRYAKPTPQPQEEVQGELTLVWDSEAK